MPERERKPVPETEAGKKQKSNIKGPWPDGEARQQMSQANAEENMGKHEKNPDWKKQW